MYITCLAGSPWAKTVSFLSKVPTFLPSPVESRNFFTSKARFRGLVRFGERGTLIDTLRLARGTIKNNNMTAFGKSVQNCTICTVAHEAFARHETTESVADSATYKQVHVERAPPVSVLSSAFRQPAVLES